MGNYSEIVFEEVFLKAHDEFMAQPPEPFMDIKMYFSTHDLFFEQGESCLVKY